MASPNLLIGGDTVRAVWARNAGHYETWQFYPCTSMDQFSVVMNSDKLKTYRLVMIDVLSDLVLQTVRPMSVESSASEMLNDFFSLLEQIPVLQNVQVHFN